MLKVISKPYSKDFLKSSIKNIIIISTLFASNSFAQTTLSMQEIKTLTTAVATDGEKENYPNRVMRIYSNEVEEATGSKRQISFFDTDTKYKLENNNGVITFAPTNLGDTENQAQTVSFALPELSSDGKTITFYDVDSNGNKIEKNNATIPTVSIEQDGSLTVDGNTYNDKDTTYGFNYDEKTGLLTITDTSDPNNPILNKTIGGGKEYNLSRNGRTVSFGETGSEVEKFTLPSIKSENGVITITDATNDDGSVNKTPITIGFGTDNDGNTTLTIGGEEKSLGGGDTTITSSTGDLLSNLKIGQDSGIKITDNSGTQEIGVDTLTSDVEDKNPNATAEEKEQLLKTALKDTTNNKKIIDVEALNAALPKFYSLNSDGSLASSAFDTSSYVAGSGINFNQTTKKDEQGNDVPVMEIALDKTNADELAKLAETMNNGGQASDEEKGKVIDAETLINYVSANDTKIASFTFDKDTKELIITEKGNPEYPEGKTDWRVDLSSIGGSEVKAGDNLTETQNADGSKTISLNPQLNNIESINFTNGTSIGMAQDGQGVDMGNQRVQGVAAPVAPTDAANKQYVDSAMGNLDGRISKLEDRAYAGIASAAALAAVPQTHELGKSVLGVGVGGYSNKKAIAIAYSYNTEGNWKIKGGVSANGEKVLWNAGVGYSW